MCVGEKQKWVSNEPPIRAYRVSEGNEPSDSKAGSEARRSGSLRRVSRGVSAG